jgi:hypothetical protein
MAHAYEVHTSDGQSYDVTVQEHHDDHPNDAFKKHLLDVIKGSVSGVISASVIRFAYKGRR